MNDLRDRFEAISKGRSVRVNERQNTLFNQDFNVSYEEETASYVTEFTHHGHFEEAYCFIERWIKRHAEKLDGSYTPPPTGHIDCRGVGLYWMLERPFNRYWADVQDAIRQQYALLERERPNEGVTGEVTVESRLMALRGFLEFLKPVADDVQAAILSPSSVECLSVVNPNFVECLAGLGFDVPDLKIRIEAAVEDTRPEPHERATAHGEISEKVALMIARSHLPATTHLEATGADFPSIYGVDLSDCWVFFINRPNENPNFRVIRSSEIVAISRETGRVVYAGTTYDEG
jgi:hypothetical protein